MECNLHPLGDNGIIIQLGEEISVGTREKVKSVSALLDRFTELDWFVEYIPAFTTVTVIYDPAAVSFGSQGESPYIMVSDKLAKGIADLKTTVTENERIVEIPVCYGGELGPDLKYVADVNRISADEVIHLHSTGDYIVHMIGFAPGFPYIGGMPEQISAPRKKSPRLKIPAGSIGIAGSQTGVYPIETPGGWQLIGRTPLKLFRPEKEIPSLLRAGDKIKFVPITLEEYRSWEDSDK
ncbi:5-oxoprolinase subunit PxpB [Peribacillus sp. SCS-155]|uniref:5-oxoprolinase subunit PxpB n=1 Tax=Peribacillus sedimenti TaxID=3115297 RepID=UPI0039063BCC